MVTPGGGVYLFMPSLSSELHREDEEASHLRRRTDLHYYIIPSLKKGAHRRPAAAFNLATTPTLPRVLPLINSSLRVPH